MTEKKQPATGTPAKEKSPMTFYPILISFIALAVQWGVVTTKISTFESVLETHGKSMTKMQQDISFIKGKMDK